MSAIWAVWAGCTTTIFAAPPNPLRNSLASHDASRWIAAITAFSRQAAAPPADAISFIGSSSIGGWTTLAADFPDKPVVRRGFGGSQLADLVIHLERLALPPASRQIVIYAGANDITVGKPPEIVLGDFAALVDKIRRLMPKTEIAFISIAPNPGRWAWIEQVKAANRLIKEHCQMNGVVFIDVYSAMLGADGRPLPRLFQSDQVHMNAEGYALWREIVRPYLK
jgi:lysophospholipase L1-like esterase